MYVRVDTRKQFDRVYLKSRGSLQYFKCLLWEVKVTIVGRNLLFLVFQVKPKHLSCIGVCCFLLAARIVEEECNIPSTHDVIRISQCKCTASDIKRMEKIISEKLHYEFEATTALNFLHLYHTIVLCHTSERLVGLKMKILYFSIAISNSKELACQ